MFCLPKTAWPPTSVPTARTWDALGSWRHLWSQDGRGEGSTGSQACDGAIALSIVALQLTNHHHSNAARIAALRQSRQHRRDILGIVARAT